MQVPILRTKLHIPGERSGLVARPRLLEKLHPGLHGTLTLVSAPAGFGKTTLVSEWVKTFKGSSINVPTFCWLSLDRDDNDPVRFFTYLAAALQRADPEIGQSVWAMIQTRQRLPPTAMMTELINNISSISTKLALVLDDYQFITAAPIHESLTYLLENMPPALHLVIITRADPPLPLARLRASGQMSEIRAADLRFTTEEAEELLNERRGLHLSGDQVEALEARTEGWIAGLQMVALSMRGSQDLPGFIKAFTGTHRYIVDYLVDEVIDHQTERVRTFLLHTSILERMTGALCDVVAGQTESQLMLENLDRANLFVVALDDRRQWYRYHHLFADVLRHRLRKVAPERIPELHQLASAWYERKGLQAEAVRHALAASDWDRAATLIENVHTELLNRGEVTTLLGWFRSIPDEEVRARPMLSFVYSWLLILTGKLDAAESYLALAEPIAQEDPAFRVRLSIPQAYLARLRGDNQRTIELSERALSLLPEAEPQVRSVAAMNLGIAHWNSGHLKDAEQALEEAERASQQAGNDYSRLTALSYLGWIQEARGKLHRSAELHRRAIRLGEGTPPTAGPHIALGGLLYEWNDLESAADHLARGIQLSQRSGNVEIQIRGYHTLARLRQAQNDSLSVEEALRKARHLVRDHDVTPGLHAREAACHIRIALAQGNLAAAMRWAEQVPAQTETSPFYMLLGPISARLLLAQGKKAAAAEQLAAWYEAADRFGWGSFVVEARVVQSLAAPTANAARVFLAAALALAEPEGFVRIFLDEGAHVADLLARLKKSPYRDRLLEAFSDTKMQTLPSALPEPLSARELEVLRLLAAGKTYSEIAQGLFISVNTVKSHLKNIYGKLEVSNRREAAAKAREFNLLS